MSERKTQIKCLVTRIDLICNDCNKPMKIKGLITVYKPPLWKFWEQSTEEYEYQCPKCGKRSHSGTYYPILEVTKEYGKNN